MSVELYLNCGTPYKHDVFGTAYNFLSCRESAKYKGTDKCTKCTNLQFITMCWRSTTVVHDFCCLSCITLSACDFHAYSFKSATPWSPICHRPVYRVLTTQNHAHSSHAWHDHCRWRTRWSLR